MLNEKFVFVLIDGFRVTCFILNFRQAKKKSDDRQKQKTISCFTNYK